MLFNAENALIAMAIWCFFLVPFYWFVMFVLSLLLFRAGSMELRTHGPIVIGVLLLFAATLVAADGDLSSDAIKVSSVFWVPFVFAAFSFKKIVSMFTVPNNG